MLLKELGEEETYYYHPDHLGSVSVVSNHRGEPYERVEYLPFGELWIEETDPATSYIPFRFTSKEYDEETGLYYYGARYYEPRLSRWMSADPSGFDLINPMDEDGEPRAGYSVIEAANWYSYAGNNPVLYVDPTGLTITVIGNRAYKSQVQTALQKIDPNTTVDMTTGEVSYGRVTKGHENGHRLIARMVDSKHDIKIAVTTRGNAAGAKNINDAANPEKGSGGIVFWNPNSHITVDTVDPATGTISKQGRDTSIGLGHELIHGDHYQRGEYNPDMSRPSYTGLDGKTHNARIEEQRTVGVGGHNTAADITENQLRVEQSVGKRAHY